MKIRIDYYDLGLTIERPDDITSNDLLQDFVNTMIMMGYHPESIKRSVIELADEYNEDSSNK